MNLKQTMRLAGLLVFSDIVDIDHRRYTPEAEARRRRFSNFRTYAAKLKHSTAGAYPARLVALDMVLPSHLQFACKQRLYRYQKRPHLEWAVGDPPRIERRQVSSLTALSCPVTVSDHDQIGDLITLLGETKEYKNIPSEGRMDELELDMCCWAVRTLTAPIAAHVTGMRPMWGVSRETLGREELRRVLKSTIQASNENRELELAAFLDAAHETESAQVDDGLLISALKFLKSEGGKTSQENMDSWLGKLLDLKDRLATADPVTAIIICWMMDLIESGTVKTPEAAIETRVRYISLTALRLWRAIKATGKKLEDLNAARIEAIYISMVKDPSCTDRGGLSAGISSFQSYAEEIWDFPEVRAGLSKFIPPPIPRVQIVHGHEVQLGLKWLADIKDCDSYLLEICSLMLDVFDKVPCRLDELHWCRIGNVKFNTDFTKAEIELYPAPGRRFKNVGSVRRQVIEDTASIGRLRLWVAKRRADGADDSDLLFGFDMLPGLYRRSLVVATLRIILKAVTGDPSMTIHGLRHTVATRNFERNGELKPIDRNRNAEVAELMGQVAPPMAFHFYIHIYEKALAAELQLLNESEFDFFSSDSQNLIGISDDLVRAHSSRLGISIPHVIWNGLDAKAGALALSQIANADEWAEATPPALKVAGRVALSPMKVLQTIRKLVGSSCHEVAITCDLEIEIVRRISDHVLSSARKLWKTRTDNYREKSGAISNFSEALAELSIDIKAANEPKYSGMRLRLSDDLDRGVLKSFADIFPDIFKGDYIRLDRSWLLVPLFEYLKVCGVQAQDLLVRTEPCKTEKAQTLETEIKAAMTATWHAHSTFKPTKLDHPSRTSAYLHWPRSAGKHDSRSVNIQGLRTLMFCTTLFVLLSKGNSHADA